MEILEKAIHNPYQANQGGGLAGYLDKFLSALHELEILQKENFTEMNKKRILLANLTGTVGASHLIQHCRDSQAYMTFADMTKYLRENSLNVEGESNPVPRKRVIYQSSHDEEVGQSTQVYLSLQETSDLFADVTRESTILNAYKSFSSGPIRQSLHIHPDIWKQLSTEIQEKISAIKAELHEKRKQATPPSTGPPFPPSIPL